MRLNNIVKPATTLAVASLAGLLLTTGCRHVVYEPKTYTQEGEITSFYTTQREVKAMDQLSGGDKFATGFGAGLLGPVGLILLGAASDIKTKVTDYHMIADTGSLECDDVIAPSHGVVSIGTPVKVNFEEKWRVVYENNEEISRTLNSRYCTIIK